LSINTGQFIKKCNLVQILFHISFLSEPISKLAWAWQKRFSRLARRAHRREYLKGISPVRSTPPDAKIALFQWNAAAHLAERRSASGDIAFGYAFRLHALLCQMRRSHHAPSQF